MPKLKTKKSVSKRVKITKKKKIVRSKAGRRHLLSCKKTKRKRDLRRQCQVSSAERKMVREAMPYSA
ncbi:MAG: 50S ribosomal protein L35 [Candidatus Omnitrophica bacterium]|nr:50S ribosomal protein L35 [Candidatus Omnitrophota bacterium]MDD5429467.1 50S ribosomal protein L35 [Candidatus Omnitrophota bacterium]